MIPMPQSTPPDPPPKCQHCSRKMLGNMAFRVAGTLGVTLPDGLWQTVTFQEGTLPPFHSISTVAGSVVLEVGRGPVLFRGLGNRLRMASCEGASLCPVLPHNPQHRHSLLCPILRPQLAGGRNNSRAGVLKSRVSL